jgi:hypothetical protein
MRGVIRRQARGAGTRPAPPRGMTVLGAPKLDDRVTVVAGLFSILGVGGLIAVMLRL